MGSTLLLGLPRRQKTSLVSYRNELVLLKILEVSYTGAETFSFLKVCGSPSAKTSTALRPSLYPHRLLLSSRAGGPSQSGHGLVL